MGLAWHQHKRHLANVGGINAAHKVFARLQERSYEAFTLVTQNIDGFHTRAGSRDVIELHGSVHRARCQICQQVDELRVAEDETLPRCERCGSLLRPDVVWFGDDLPSTALQLAEEAFMTADVAVVAGTSGRVYPAAYLPVYTARGGGRVIEINPERTQLSAIADIRVKNLDWTEHLLEALRRE